MSAKTLASLALIKSRYDSEKSDVLDTLRPFVALVVAKRGLVKLTAIDVQSKLLDEFGIAIPRHSVELLLRRLARSGQINKVGDNYDVVKLDNNVENFERMRADATRHQSASILGLVDYAATHLNQALSEDDAESSLYNYIDQYSIDCIKAYSSGSIVPVHGKSNKHWHFIVSSYVNYISTREPDKFKHLLTVVMGRMLSNAFLGEDLIDTAMHFSDTTVYLDTPIVLQLLGVLGDAPQLLAEEMLVLLRKVKAKIRVFEHVTEEIDAILRTAEHLLELPSGGRGNVIINLREIGRSPSDVAMLRASLGDQLEAKGVIIEATPAYVTTFQIDEAALEAEMTTSGLLYRADAARRTDINSIRAIYVLRRRKTPRKVENCGAIFITNNSGLARAAYAYGRRHEESQGLSTVITDFSLTNLLWLKAPVDYVDVPRKMIAVDCYAALRPSDTFWGAFLKEVEKLEKIGLVTATQHQYLRYELRVRQDLMNLTLGDPETLTDDQVMQVLSRHEHELTKPLKDRVAELTQSVEAQQSKLQDFSGQIQGVKQRIRSIGATVRRVVSAMLLIMAAVLFAIAHGWIDISAFTELNIVATWLLRIGVYIADAFILAHVLWHVSVWNPVSKVANKVEQWVVKGICEYLGIRDE